MKKYIAITRPEPQASILAQLLQQHAYASLVLPALEIQYVTQSRLQQGLADVGADDYIIFLSQHAVAACRNAGADLPVAAHYFAIGPATAKALQRFMDGSSGGPHILNNATVYIAEQYSSEGILAMPALQQVQARNIHIFSAEQSRGLVDKELKKRGAQVVAHPSYTYRPATREVQQRLRQALAANELSLVIATSCYAIDQLSSICQPNVAQALHAVPLLVTSDRMGQHAQQLGWSSIQHADDASVLSILDTVRECVV